MGAPRARRALTQADPAQLEPERAADVLRALEADCHVLGAEADAPRATISVAQRETQAGAADLAGVRGIDAEEAREHLRLLPGRDAEPGIADADADDPVRAGCGDRHRAARGRVLDRVGQQVGEHLPDAVAVADQRERLAGRSELDPLTAGLRRAQFHLVVDEVGQLERLEGQREAPGLDLLQIEEVVDECRQPLRLALDRLGVAPARVVVEIASPAGAPRSRARRSAACAARARRWRPDRT